MLQQVYFFFVPEWMKKQDGDSSHFANAVLLLHPLRVFLPTILLGMSCLSAVTAHHLLGAGTALLQFRAIALDMSDLTTVVALSTFGSTVSSVVLSLSSSRIQSRDGWKIVNSAITEVNARYFCFKLASFGKYETILLFRFDSLLLTICSLSLLFSDWNLCTNTDSTRLYLNSSEQYPEVFTVPRL